MKKNAKKKRQHYIPQYYLKNFSNGGEYINVFLFKSRKSLKNNIKNLCKEDFFYGSDDKAIEFEQNLSLIERMHRNLLNKIIQNMNLDYLDYDEYVGLLTFILLQISRTRSAKKNSYYLANLINKGYRLNEKISSPNPSDIEAFKDLPRDLVNDINNQYRRAFGLTMLGAINSIEGIMDLKPTLLINISQKNYICGDSPVVLYNGIKFNNIRLTGLLTPGLQIFCPINNEITLFFYDSNAYNIDFDYESIVYVDNESDINSLNKLQISNALDFVLFSDINQKHNIEEIYNEIDSIVDNVFKYNFGSYENGEQILKRINGNMVQIFGFLAKKTNYTLNLSFIRLNSRYADFYKKEYNELLKDHPFPNPIRNKDLADKALERLEKSYKKLLN